MSALFIYFVTFCFIALSFQAPFIAALMYIWADLADPQNLGYGFIREVPMSLITGIFAIFAYLLLDRKYPPKPNITMFCLILLAMWVTASSFWAEFQTAAWIKWDWAIKAILFAAVTPLFFRTRMQIEAAILVINFSLLNYFMPRAVKFLLGQSGYMEGDYGNSGLHETSTIALVCAMLIPLNLYLANYSQIFANAKIRRILFWGIALLCPLAILNTFARTGLVALAVFVAVRFFLTKKKFQYVLVAVAMIFGLLLIAPQEWFDRMTTIQQFESDGSAMVRIAVWAGTIDYVTQNPFGAGFGGFLANKGTYFGYDIAGRAYHNSFIEALGEHGYIGFGLFVIIHVSTLISLGRMIKLTKNDQSAVSLRELLKTLFVMHVTFLSGSMFVGIAFQSSTYYVVSITMCLSNYIRRFYVPVPVPRPAVNRVVN